MADDVYIKEYMNPMMELVEHEAILQLPLDVRKDLPMKAEVLAIEEFTMTGQDGFSEEDLEKEVKDEQKLFRKRDWHGSVSGWDVWPEVIGEKKRLPQDGADRLLVRITGWNNKDCCETTLLDPAIAGSRPTKTSILRQLMW